MGLRPANLLTRFRSVGPLAYLAWGLGLFAVKYGLDAGVAFAFGHSWSLLNYFVPSLLGIAWAQPEDQVFFGMMMVVAVPFLAAGLALTLGRLRDAGSPLWLAFLFFVPLVNLGFFITFCLTPSRLSAKPIAVVPPPFSEDPGTWPDAAGPSPSSKGTGSTSLVAVFLPAPFALGLTLLGTFGLRDYGWGLFFGIPFGIGVASAVLLGRRKPAPAGACLAIGQAALLAYGGLLFAVAVEGFICILMAWPLAAVATYFGSLMDGPCRHASAGRRRPRGSPGPSSCCSRR